MFLQAICLLRLDSLDEPNTATSHEIVLSRVLILKTIRNLYGRKIESTLDLKLAKRKRGSELTTIQICGNL